MLTHTVQLCNWNDAAADEKKNIQMPGKMQISDGAWIRMRQWASKDKELWD